MEQNCLLCDDCAMLKLGDVYYEIHITLKNSEDAIEWAEQNKVKLIHIHMGDDIPTQLMTSVIVKGSRDHAKTRCATLLVSLIKHDVEVIRTKIESTLNSPEDALYYELHASALPLTDIDAKKLQLHKSTNLLKKGVSLFQMYTYRTKSRKDILNKAEELKDYDFHKIIIEKCILDTNEEIDKRWLNILET